MIKNIIFDVGNVLLKWDANDLAANYATDEEEKETLKRIIFKSKEWYNLDAGTLNYDNAIKIFKENLPDNLKEKVDLIMNTWYKKMPINNEICELIKKLKQNDYKIYVLSNAHIPVYEYVKKLDVSNYIDGFIISAIEKMMKPDEKIYEKLFNTFNLNPKECFFIDDLQKNIEVGNNFGMQGHIFEINNFNELEKSLNRNGIRYTIEN